MGLPTTLLPLVLLAISLVGIPTVLVVRIIAYIEHPDLFIGTLPTISKTAAFAPGTQIFAIGMTCAAICIIIAWPLAWLVNRRNIERFTDAGYERWLLYSGATLATLSGIVAGVMLAALANVSLEDNDPQHVAFSWGFFISQVVAFIIDTIVALRLRARSRRFGYGYPLIHLNFKPRLTIAISLLALLFLVIYLTKGIAPLDDSMAVRHLYVTTEYLLAVLCLYYPTAYYPEVRCHFGSPRVLLMEQGGRG